MSNKQSNEEYLKQLLINLSKPIPYKWRVQSFSQYKEEATVVAYIDARDAMDLLDEYCIYGWTRRHYEVKGNVYCTVGIYMPDGSIIERSDCGIESNTEAKKGEASDSFKRASVNFKVGRFLYDLKLQYVRASEKKAQGKFPYCIDENGKRINDISKYINDRNQSLTTPIEPMPLPILTLEMALSEVSKVTDLKDLATIWTKFKAYQTVPSFVEAKDKMKAKLSNISK